MRPNKNNRLYQFDSVDDLLSGADSTDSQLPEVFKTGGPAVHGTD